MTGVALVQRRIGLLFGAFFVLLVVAMLRTVDLGLLRSGSLSAAANEQHLTRELVPALRGAITDRNGVYLAVSEPADDVAATPYLIKDPVSAAQQLAPLLGVSTDSVLAKITRRSGFVYLARGLRQAQAQAIANLNIPGMTLTPTTRRVYPRRDLAAQVLGLVGLDGQGLAGLEYSLNAALHGRAGQRTIVSDAIGQPISINDARAEVAGANVSLTLDSAIQQRTEDVLNAVGQIYQPLDATAIVMNPNDGSILALANWPPVNANDPGQRARRPRCRTASSASTTSPARRSRSSRSPERSRRGSSRRIRASTCRRRSRSPTGRSTTPRRAARRRSRSARSSRSRATSARSRSGGLLGPD